MSLVILTLMAAVHMTACDYWKPTQSFESPESPRSPRRVLIDDDSAFDVSRYLTLLIWNWPAGAVDEIYFYPVNAGTGYGHRGSVEDREFVFTRPSREEPAVLCREDGQAIDGFRSNPAFEEICIVDGLVTLRRKKEYSFEDDPVLLWVTPVNTRSWRRSEFLYTTGILLDSDDSPWFEEGGVIRNYLNWPASAVDRIYLRPINEETGYGYRSTSRLYIFIRPREDPFPLLCRDDGKPIDGFQQNPAFSEVCIADRGITLRKKQDYSFKENPAYLYVAPVPGTPRPPRG